MQHLTELKPLNPFTQVPNDALDTLPDLNSIGLLAVVLRHTAGWHFTVDKLIEQKKRIPGPKLGRDAAYGAMRTLVAHRWVAKVKYRDAKGHQHTAVFRTSERFTEADYIEICRRYTRGATLATTCSACTGEEDSVITTVMGGALLVGPDGEAKVADVLAKAQVSPTYGIPTVGHPTAGSPAAGKPTAIKKNSKHTSKKTGEGEEGARAREIDPPTTDSSNDDEWGIAPTERPAAEQGTLLARTVVAQIAEETGLGLEQWQHKRLVLEHLPAALDAVRALGDDAVSPTELLEWLAADHDTTMSLYAVLSRRCAPDYLRQALPIWVARTRTPGGLPAPSKPTAPRPRVEAPDAAPDPFTRAGAPPTCLIHPGIALTADATGQRTRCHMCEAPPEPALVDDSPTPNVEDLADVIGDALPDTEPDLPDHCGNRACHEHRRHIIRFNSTTQDFQDLGPCPRCHPDRAQEPAA